MQNKTYIAKRLGKYLYECSLCGAQTTEFKPYCPSCLVKLKRDVKPFTKASYNEIKEALAQWRKERYLTIEGQREGLITNLHEELKEYKEAQSREERVDALCDMFVLIENADCWDIENRSMMLYDFMDVERFVETIIIPRIQQGKKLPNPLFQTLMYYIEIEEGYRAELSLQETIKEISSRVGRWDTNKKKFIKDTSPEAKALWYKADYEKARLW